METRSLPTSEEDKKCFECAGMPTTWASVSLGLHLCMKCAGKHRSLGVHLSFVRSHTLDTWKPHQLKIMELGGNQRAREFFKCNAISEDTIDNYHLQQKYETEEAHNYRETLKKEAADALGNEYTPTPMPSRPSISREAFAESNIARQSFQSSNRLVGKNKDEGSRSCCTLL